MYDTREEAQQKLANSTVLFEGKPVQILEATGSKNKVILRYHSIPYPQQGIDGPTDSVHIADTRWDFKSLGTKLGYVNINKSPFDAKQEAVFATRIPTRNSRQGLDQRTGRVSQYPSPEHPWIWDHLLNHTGIVDCINNKYPTAAEAVNQLTADCDMVRSVAIGRKLMMIFDRVNPPNLVYRNNKVGYTEDGITFKLAPHKAFLKEELIDMLGLKIA